MTPEAIAAIIEDHKFPTLHAGETGIHVITLQIWLQMLGFYPEAITGLLDAATAQAVDAFRAQQRATGVALQAPTGAVLERDTWAAMDDLLKQRLPPDPDALDRLPLPRRSSYDSDDKYQKALYEGLRGFGFPIEPAAAPIRIPIAFDASGLGAMHGVPPGSYELQIDHVGKPAEGSAELHLEDGDGAPLQGRLQLVHGGLERSVTVAGGQAQVAGLAPGEYEVILDRVDPTPRILEDTGSLAIDLVDAHDAPTGGAGYLVGETGETASIQQAVKLFKALHRGLDRGLDPDERSGLGSNLLTGRFDDTAHDHHARAWQSFRTTWGRFYGAPWMGIVFHPEPASQGSVPGELNWGTFQTIRMLQQWGAAYLQASTDEQDVLDRLQQPIAVRYIARPLGGPIDRRSDFSRTGTQASLHLQRRSPRVVDGLSTGQCYGGIDYRSPEYSSAQMERQLAVLVSLEQEFHALTPDEGLVDRLVAPELVPFVTRLTNDGFPASKTVNTIVGCFVAGLFKNRRRKQKKEELLSAARKAGGAQLAEILATADSRIFKSGDLQQIRGWIDQSGGGPFNSVAWEHVRSVQKALWWCKLLVAAGQFDKAREWSARYLDIGCGGLFTAYENITSKTATPDLRFSFDDDDWKNLLQLESLVEFYLNYNDPNRPAASFRAGEPQDGIRVPRLPRLTAGSSYEAAGVTGGLGSGLHLVLIDCFGARNNAQGKSIARGTKLAKLTDNQFSVTPAASPAKDDDSDLRDHPENHVLWLQEDSNRASASYRILGTMASGKTYNLTLDGNPSAANNTPWEILRSSAWLSGGKASSTGNRVTLDAKLSQINPDMDTIHLATDAARPSRVYRITSMIDASTVVVDGQPELADTGSAWRIPGGIGGRHPPLKYKTSDEPLKNRLPKADPHHVTGYDHYDGLLFLIYNGTIEDRFRFTSYSSHVRPPPWRPKETELASLSIRGNKAYDITSEPADGNQYANFSFAVNRHQTLQRDGSRYYNAKAVGTSHFTKKGKPYPPGATDDVFVHHGFENPPTGSASCQVSPQFYELRNAILSLFRTQGPAGASLYARFHGKSQRWSEGVYTEAAAEMTADAAAVERKGPLPGRTARNRLANLGAAWSGKIQGTLWLIRPDERPLADYSVLLAP